MSSMGSMGAADIVTAYLDALGDDDPDAVAAFVASDFANEHFSTLGSNSIGRDEYRRRLPGFMEAFAGRHYEIDAVVEQAIDDGTQVVARYRLTATCDGVDIDVPGMMWLTVRHGEISRRIDCWDSLTFLDQTGLDQTGLDQTGLDQTGLDQTGLDQTGPNQTAPNQTGP